DGGTAQEREQQGGDGGARRAKGEVVEQIEEDVLLRERREQMIEHVRSLAPRQFRCGNTRSSATPRDALSRTISLPVNAALRRGPSAAASGAMSSRRPSAARCGSNAGTNSPTAATSAGSSAVISAAASACNLALSGPSSNIEPTTTARGRPRRRASQCANCSAQRSEPGFALQVSSMTVKSPNSSIAPRPPGSRT